MGDFTYNQLLPILIYTHEIREKREYPVKAPSRHSRAGVRRAKLECLSLSSSRERETVNLFVVRRCTRTTALRWQQGMYVADPCDVVRAQSHTTCRMYA
jgi:hypothetical protein